jgi:DNA polymerase elongation subunit (family B)
VYFRTSKWFIYLSCIFSGLCFFAKKCTSINNGVILVPSNKSRLKQAISVMFISLPFLHRACNSMIILTDALSILIYFDTHQAIPVFWMYKEERQSVNKSSSPKKTPRFISSTLKMWWRVRCRTKVRIKSWENRRGYMERFIYMILNTSW